MLDIIVATKNTPTLFNKWYDYVKRNTSIPYRIYVTDNSTTDDIKNGLHGKTLDYTREPFNGLSKAINGVANKGSNPFIAIINSDCFVPQNWSEKMINYIGLKDLGVITSTDSRNVNNNVHKYLPYKDITEETFEKTALDLQERYITQEKVYAYEVEDYIKTNITGGERQDCSPATGNACFIVKRSVFEDVGGFDEEFGLYYEDIDFLGRINKKYKVGLAYDVLVYHVGSVTVKQEGFDENWRYKSGVAFGKRWSNG